MFAWIHDVNPTAKPETCLHHFEACEGMWMVCRLSHKRKWILGVWVGDCIHRTSSYNLREISSQSDSLHDIPQAGALQHSFNIWFFHPSFSQCCFVYLCIVTSIPKSIFVTSILTCPFHTNLHQLLLLAVRYWARNLFVLELYFLLQQQNTKYCTKITTGTPALVGVSSVMFYSCGIAIVTNIKHFFTNS